MSELNDMIDLEVDKKEWIKPIKGLNDYLITTNGAVWSKKRKKWLKSFVNPADGYLQIKLGKKNCRVHQLVAQTFIRSYDVRKEQTHHKNHVRSDCSLQNLQIVSIEQHYKDKIRIQKQRQKVTGMKRTQQIKRKISEGHKGLKQSQQTIQKRIATMKRNRQNKERL